MNKLTSSAKNIKIKNADELFYTDEIREKMKKKVDEFTHRHFINLYLNL